MAKDKFKPDPRKGDSGKSSDQDQTPKEPTSFARTLRETVESVVIAFILAFMFRTFEAEAFVIPTGSMAPTLQGRHKDLACPNCGYWYRSNASGDDERADREVTSVTCPNCRWTVDGPDLNSQYKSYNGDRILVAKFPFEFFAGAFGEPKRWEVIVFKFPNNAKQNYIKRLIGLPGERIKIDRGDIYVQSPGEAAPHLERKPPDKVRAMLQMVYDNDYVTDKANMTAKGWPLRWTEKSEAAGQTGWRSDDGGRSYHVAAEGNAAHWLQYRHLPPSADDWSLLNALKSGETLTPEQLDQRAHARLIGDTYAYDLAVSKSQSATPADFTWVGDLALECLLRVDQPRGQTVLDLVKGGRHFRCQLDLSTGFAELTISGSAGNAAGENAPFHTNQAGQPVTKLTSRSPVLTGAGEYRVLFANVDEQLHLWINGSLVEFDAATTYDSLNNYDPQPDDYLPVGIASVGASLKVSGLKVWRDIYYLAAEELKRMPPHSAPPIPAEGKYSLAKDGARPMEDQFMMLGDNSPASSDSRFWGFVPRKLLVGKALFIYWPHSFDKIPGLNIPFPYFPNFERMGFVR